MNKLPKIFLVISLVTFAIGLVIWFSAIKVAPEWTVIMPISAVAFGLSLITLILEKEMTQFDEEETRRLKLARQNNNESKKAMVMKTTNTNL